MDQYDRATELEEAARDQAIAQQRQQLSGVSLSHCNDCGDAIPDARRKIGGISRCIFCQRDLEKRLKK